MWAQVFSMTPSANTKGNMAEGGIRSGSSSAARSSNAQPGASTAPHARGRTLCPRCSEAAGASYPKTINGQEAPPLIGKSWVKMLAGEQESPRLRRITCVGNLRQPRGAAGRLEIGAGNTSRTARSMELFNLAADPGERRIGRRTTREGQDASGASGDDYVRAKAYPAHRVMWEDSEAASRSGIRWWTVTRRLLSEAVHPSPRHAGRRSRDPPKPPKPINEPLAHDNETKHARRRGASTPGAPRRARPPVLVASRSSARCARSRSAAALYGKASPAPMPCRCFSNP